MEDLERQLKSLSLRGPSAELDARVLAALARPAPAPAPEPVRPRVSRRAVSVRWALAAALLMGLLGFLAGRLSTPRPGQLAQQPAADAAGPAVTVHVVYEGRAANPFDCTVAADDGLRPIKEIKIESHSGV